MTTLTDPSLFQTSSFINNEWVDHQDDQLEVINPSTNQIIAKVTDGTRSDAEDAVNAAQKAFNYWSGLTAKERASVLQKWFQLILENTEDLAKIMTLEQGKPISEARNEIIYGASFIEFYAEECKRVLGNIIPTVDKSRRLFTYKQAIGVVGCITPWNFPNAMITRKAAPALAAGCTVVIKPDPKTPLSALALCELAKRAGLPSGVLNVVAGTDSQGIGEVLTQHPSIAKFTFTGSTATGKILMAQCAKSIKKVSLELGGNAPFIVFNDANIDEAVEHCIATKFRNCGQTCVCTNRIYVQNDVIDNFVSKLKTGISKLKVADGFEEGATIGPMIDRKAVEKMDSFMSDAKSNGAAVLLGGKRHALGGFFYEPTLLINTSKNMRILNEEIFGPIAAVESFSSEEEVIAEANSTNYGLAAYFFTRDIGRVMRLSESLEYGIVCSNSGVFSTEVAPFGGWKQSGIGSEGGKEGIQDFYETKFHSMGGINT